MRIVPDVNVLVSALITPSSPPGRILRAWRDGTLEIITSRPIIRKLAEVLYRPSVKRALRIDEQETADFLRLVERQAILAPHHLELRVVEQDPEDDTIIIAAVETQADGIISGDHHLTDLGHYQQIPIYTPTEFVIRYQL